MSYSEAHFLVCIVTVEVRNIKRKFSCLQISKNRNDNILRISALASKMGRIKKIYISIIILTLIRPWCIQMKCIYDNWFRQQLSKILFTWKHGGEQLKRLQRKKSSPNEVLPRVSNEVHTCIDDNQFRQQLSWNLSKTPYAAHYISTNTLETVGKVTCSEYATIIFAWHCTHRMVSYIN